MAYFQILRLPFVDSVPKITETYGETFRHGVPFPAQKSAFEDISQGGRHVKKIPCRTFPAQSSSIGM
jgi:hypothetical protein